MCSIVINNQVLFVPKITVHFDFDSAHWNFSPKKINFITFHGYDILKLSKKRKEKSGNILQVLKYKDILLYYKRLIQSTYTTTRGCLPALEANRS